MIQTGDSISPARTSNPPRLAAGHHLVETAAQGPIDQMSEAFAQAGQAARTGEFLLRSVSMQSKKIANEHTERFAQTMGSLASLIGATQPAGIAKAWTGYGTDAVRRLGLTVDVLRERGDVFLDHEAAGCPPVLIYDYERVMDGADLQHPCNYELLRILPPPGVEVHDWKRPYVIIDPRAGHGGGIGGFKPDSQVGVALHDGHPVYFVSFRRDPEPGQTLADVTRAEAAFMRKVERLHPDAARPVVAGNCQGGWATLLLAASNPDLTGPIVLNGAPVQPWSGEIGKNPMRYNAGVLGGTWQPMFWSDLGGGQFDGAHLVMNFEQLNPGRNFFRKYFDLFVDPEGGRSRFLEFERWWGGYFILNEAEIRWIVEQLFVGNRLAKNIAQLEPGRAVDVKAVKAPVIVFTSQGDNITPPQQALNWIVDSYADADEIKIRGQRIVYMVHEQVGHLGIFVSSKIAKKEHTEVASTLKTIEALAPGLYEMVIDDVIGSGRAKTFIVSFYERRLQDIRTLDDGRDEEVGHAAVARLSEAQAEAYDIAVRPMIRAAVNPGLAKAARAFHPLRLQRSAMSSRNPAMTLTRMALPFFSSLPSARADNPFIAAERLMADLIEQQIDLLRDLRDAAYEGIFLAAWTNPVAAAFGKPRTVGRTLKSEAELRTLPEVQAALAHVGAGGFVEAVIRMLVYIADSRGSVRRDRLERATRVLTQDEPFASLSGDERARIIHEQTLISTFDHEGGIETLPRLLPNKVDRARALQVVQFVPGPIAEMAPGTLKMLQRFHAVLEMPPITEDVVSDPLSEPAAAE